MAKVILADDEEFVRMFLRDSLQEFSFDVVAEVDNGLDLVEAMGEYKPDILLLDINMPNLTGKDFLEQYSHNFPETCIIILTSIASANYLKHERIQAVLRKDLNILDLIAAIEGAWSKFKKENW